jgi:diguanylate cyclase (GGDEF)-like protein
MNIPFAAILLLDKRINIQHVTESQVIDNKGHMDTELNKLYLWTLENNLPLVLNDQTDPAWHELKTKLPYKLLSCPVTDKMGNTLGVIVSLKDKNDVDFVNSDRNLLMVMANKASKIIQTNYDSLTGLLNLQAFEYFLGKIHFSASQLVPESHTVLYIDLDHIQMINENMSHQAGDEVLRATGNLIKRLIRDIDIAARIGGDKFGVLLYNCPPDRGLTISKRINNEIKKQELMWNEKTIQITACIGLASINVNSQNILSALDDAEIACNAAKEEGKSKISFFKFGDVDHTALREEMRWAQLVQDSLNKNDLRLYCQKIHALNNENGPLHYEILLRAVDDTGAILEPKKLIPAAERYKLMPGVDRWVISNTLSILERFWENLQHKQPILSINLSGQSFRDEAFLDFILSSLQNSTIPPAAICFEITETAAIGNLIAAQNLIKSLRNIGCTIALDDFGSGLSSFTYLKNLDIDYLKIDGSIIKDVVDSNIAKAMVKAIKDVAEALQLKTIGEYVENEAIAEHLSRMGIDYAQGYFIGRPVPLENELACIISGKNTGKGRED